MKLFILRKCIVAVAALMSVNLITAAPAQEASSVKGFVREDVVAIASVDLTKVDLMKVHQWTAKSGVVSEKEAKDIRWRFGIAQGIIGGLVDSGLERISFLYRVSDLGAINPIWVASINQEKDPDQAKEALKSMLDMLPDYPQVLQVQGGHVIGGPSQEAIDSYLASDPSNHQQLSGALERVGQHNASLLIIGSSETRRVVREMWPDLPKPFEEATRDLIADKVAWGGLFIDLPPEIDLKLVFQTKDNESATQVGRVADATLPYLAKNLPPKQAQLFGEAILAKVTKQVAGNQVVINGQALLEDPGFFKKVVSGAKELSESEQRQQNLRNVVIALLNYESAYAQLPLAAICNERGEPLLSWRVAILPFIEQTELYQQFHLDEPWDSPHNLPLAQKMPSIYASAGVEAPLTTVQVPRGEGLLFDGKTPVELRDIEDGTSNTIAAVYTDSKRAVCWTKPADWEADLENPLEGLKVDDNGMLNVAFLDSSGHTINAAISKEDFAALLTRAGGEPVNR